MNFWRCMGQSGSGKSTLINIIGFLDDQFEGTYFYYEHPIHEYTRAQFSSLRNQNVGFVFQNFQIDPKYFDRRKCRASLLYAGQKRAYIKERVREVLKAVGLAGYEDQLPKNLSGANNSECRSPGRSWQSPNFWSQMNRLVLWIVKHLRRSWPYSNNLNHDNETTYHCDPWS